MCQKLALFHSTDMLGTKMNVPQFLISWSLQWGVGATKRRQGRSNSQPLQGTAPPAAGFHADLTALISTPPCASPDTVDKFLCWKLSPVLASTLLCPGHSFLVLALVLFSDGKLAFPRVLHSCPSHPVLSILNLSFSTSALSWIMTDSSVNSNFLWQWFLTWWGNSIQSSSSRSSLGDFDTLPPPLGQILSYILTPSTVASCGRSSVMLTACLMAVSIGCYENTEQVT